MSLGTAWEGSAFDPSRAAVSYLTYVSLRPVIEHIRFGPGSQMRIEVERTQASFFVVLVPLSMGVSTSDGPLAVLRGREFSV